MYLGESGYIPAVLIHHLHLYKAFHSTPISPLHDSVLIFVIVIELIYGIGVTQLGREGGQIAGQSIPQQS